MNTNDKIKRLRNKCDRLLQEINKEKNPVCENCGSQTQVGHHFITKGSCSSLRYDFDNIIPLCNSCHFAIHQKSDSRITANIVLNRGEKWYKDLVLKGNTTLFKTTLENYERVLEELKQEYEQYT